MNAQQLKSSILQLAVQGKLVPQDSNDELASVLLERIAKEREKLIKEKKIKKPKNTSHIFRRDGHFYESLNGGQPTCIDDELPFDIPDSWEWVRLGEIMQLLSGVDLKPDEYNDSSKGIPYITGASNFEDGVIIVNRWTENPKKISKKGDILITCKGTIGETALLSEDCVHIARQVMGITPIIETLTPYILLSVKACISIIISSKRGLIPGIDRETILGLFIPLPPLQEQYRIAQNVEDLIPYIEEYGKHEDELTKLNKGFPDALRKSLLQWAIQGKLVPQEENDEPASVLLERIAKERAAKLGKKATKSMSRIERRGRETYEIFPDGSEKKISNEIPFDIPDSWVWCRLEEIAMLGAGLTPSKSKPEYYNNGTIPWLQTGNLNDGYITDIPTRVSTLALNKTTLKLKPAGSVLIAMYGATIGKLGILTFPSTMNQACCCIEPYANTYNKYVFFYLFAMRQKLRESGKGGAQPNISKEKLVLQLVPLPPLQEQHRIVERLDALLKLVEVTK